MIQLANDPTASRMTFRPAAGEGKESDTGPQRPRSTHAWPFLSRYPARPVQQSQQKASSPDSGS
ncbi:MAG TPA: hypothetical protein VLI46_11655 [Ramlibacter sp.]|nr:hypothetical protein [Ramlibacter sp.]